MYIDFLFPLELSSYYLPFFLSSTILSDPRFLLHARILTAKRGKNMLFVSVPLIASVLSEGRQWRCGSGVGGGGGRRRFERR